MEFYSKYIYWAPTTCLTWILRVCKQGLEVWAFCTKLCGFLNGHKLIIYHPKSKTCKYWRAFILPSVFIQRWPYSTSSPEYLPGVQQKASCFLISCLWPEIKILQFKLWWQFSCWHEWDNGFLLSYCSIDGRRIQLTPTTCRNTARGLCKPISYTNPPSPQL